MIQGVHVYSDNGETAWLPLSDPYGTGLAVLNITGLRPVKTDLRITNYWAQSGGYYNGSRVGTRNIVFTLKPLGPDIEYVRRWAYKLLDVEEHVSMVFVTDYGDRRIDGYVESFEADIFSKNELFTVSVICPRPEFTDGDGVVLTSSSADTMNATFEFPFESDGSWTTSSSARPAITRRTSCTTPATCRSGARSTSIFCRTRARP